MKSTNIFMSGLLVLACLFTSCNDDEGGTLEAAASLQLASSTTFGDYLVDASGRTLYFSGKDVGGSSLCEGGCTTVWPVFAMADSSLGEGIEAADVSYITRTDGSLQTTYKGWPLYYFNADEQAGQINGDGAGPFRVAKPDYSVMIAQQEINEQTVHYLTDDRGTSLYGFINDTSDSSTCEGGCLNVWPIFSVGSAALVVPSGLDLTDFDTFSRDNGTVEQLTFLTSQLYFFANDNAPGDLNGLANANFFLLEVD
jgi:predicted lipoprotein with Yx(FWY)xxD motif